MQPYKCTFVLCFCVESCESLHIILLMLFIYSSLDLVAWFWFIDLSKEINTMSEEYMANVRSMDAANRTSHLKKIENAFVKSREYGDDKVQLAMQTYEMVSKYSCFSFAWTWLLNI